MIAERTRVARLQYKAEVLVRFKCHLALSHSIPLNVSALHMIRPFSSNVLAPSNDIVPIDGLERESPLEAGISAVVRDSNPLSAVVLVLLPSLFLLGHPSEELIVIILWLLGLLDRLPRLMSSGQVIAYQVPIVVDMNIALLAPCNYRPISWLIRVGEVKFDHNRP